MKIGNYVKMIKFPYDTFANEYCISHGFYIGCISKYVSDDTYGISVFLEINDVKMSVGVKFL